jgi:hypothetical protein
MNRTPVGALCLLALLAMGCGAVQHGGPQDVLRKYIAAINANQPAVAYALMEEGVRRQTTLNEFIARWKTVQPELKEQAAQLRETLAKPIKARAQISYPTGTRAGLVFDDNTWQIEEGIAVTVATATPIDALRAFVRAVEQRNYDAVMKLLAKQVRENIERDIGERVTKLKQSLSQEIEVTGNKARLQYDPRYRIELTNEDGQWKVMDFD